MSEVKLPDADYRISVRMTDNYGASFQLVKVPIKHVPFGDYLLYTADQMRQFREDGQQGMRKLNSHEEYWVDNRHQIIDCLEKAGYTLMSNQNGFFLHPKIGMGIAQDKP